MRRRTTSAGKPWVPLTGIEKPFDQTNGSVEFDPGPEDAADTSALGLLEKGAASNIVNVGFGSM